MVFSWASWDFQGLRGFYKGLVGLYRVCRGFYVSGFRVWGLGFPDGFIGVEGGMEVGGQNPETKSSCTRKALTTSHTYL